MHAISIKIDEDKLAIFSKFVVKNILACWWENSHRWGKSKTITHKACKNSDLIVFIKIARIKTDKFLENTWIPYLFLRNTWKFLFYLIWRNIIVSIKFVLLPKLKFNSFFNLKLSSTAEKKSTIILSSAFESCINCKLIVPCIITLLSHRLLLLISFAISCKNISLF